ncbi:hypothetical protein MYA98_06580 [Salmonella sp. WGH-01]|nr:hypothetical protein MYA98_06580 [Salmonella sp. WGH-01]
MSVVTESKQPENGQCPIRWSSSFCRHFNQYRHRSSPLGCLIAGSAVSGRWSDKTRKVVDPHSFRIVTNEAGEAQYHRVQFFTTGDERPG